MRNQRGFNLIEMTFVTGILGMVMVMLSETTSISASSSQALSKEAELRRKISRALDQITTELAQTTALRDHDESTAPDLMGTPSSDDASAIYNWPLTTIDALHSVAERDGTEFWHSESDDRKFYIYATYNRFDTIEFQKIQFPLDPQEWTRFFSAGNIDPWGSPRKIFLNDEGTVLMRVNGSSETRDYTLGTNIESLEFHVDAMNRIVIRISGVYTDRGQTRQITDQRVVPPRAELF